MVTLKDIRVSPDGRRVDYLYEASGRARRYFAGRPAFFIVYDRDISACPRSILAIPFVTNFEPIGWFAGFDVHVPELDATFAASRATARSAFAKMYPGRVRAYGVSAARLVPNVCLGDRCLMLFSGGLDATATLMRHEHEPLVLVTVKGADIPLEDDQQWNQCLSHIASAAPGHDRATIVSNLREFYTDDVDARLLFGWWGRVQHGHALLGLLAPLSVVVGARTSYIASSYDIPMAWGSTRVTDELLSWADCRCVHDADNLSRQQKAGLIATAALASGHPTPLRVCYSEVLRDGNCGRCEKCYRTVMNLVLSGADPRAFGLPMSDQTYPAMFRLLSRIRPSRGLIVFWGEISAAARRALAARTAFVLVDSVVEHAFLRRLADGEIDRALSRNLSPWRDRYARLKFIARVKLPRLYRAYRLAADFIRKTAR